MSSALRFAVNRAEAESLPDLFELMDEPPTLNVEEPDPSKPDDWVLTAYFADEPDAASVDLIIGLFPSAANPVLEDLPEADWTTMSQRDLAPVRAGRFIIHTADHADAVLLVDAQRQAVEHGVVAKAADDLFERDESHRARRGSADARCATRGAVRSADPILHRLRGVALLELDDERRGRG
jgi:ribosomal protein L11 methylase PrmA